MQATTVQSIWQVWAFTLVLTLLSACALYSLIAARWAAKRSEAFQQASGDYSSEIPRNDSAEDFITARSSIDVWKMAFSLYASVMGSWVITGPPIYASMAGLLGLASYAIASGTPLTVIAWAGSLARSADPEATSLPNFLLRRFDGHVDPPAEGSPRRGLLGTRLLRPGQVIATLSAVITLFCMSVAMLAEYATLGTIFRAFVGCSDGLAALPTIFMGLLTVGYTVAGGLYISILTDRIQAIVSFLLVVYLGIFLLRQFDIKLSTPLTNAQKGLTYSGYSSLVVMPISLISSTMYSEALWQRVWAAEDEKALRKASIGASLFVTLVVFFFGFVGFLALWSKKATDTTPPNLYFFVLFSESGEGTLDSIAGLLALSCAAMMSEGAVDSLQNGITATLSSTLLKNKPLLWTRLLVLVVNVPLAILGSTKLVDNILKLFLLSNMITTICFPPLLAAVFPYPGVRQNVTEESVLFGCLGGLLLTCAFGTLRAGSISGGIELTFMSNDYGWDYFVVALVSSTACTICGAGVIWIRRRAFRRFPLLTAELGSRSSHDEFSSSS